jgi:hypothetical protein
MERAVRCFRRRRFHAREEIGKLLGDQSVWLEMFPESKAEMSCRTFTQQALKNESKSLPQQI